MAVLPLTISEDKRYLVQNGTPFFYLADTVWNAFACATLQEWAVFCEYRKRQGFSMLQFSAMPVLHDASGTYTPPMPFEVRENGNWDFSKPSADYFAKARAMVELGLQNGMRPCITVLWNNYLKGTWAHRAKPEVYIPPEEIRGYCRFIVDTFGEYEPVYFISGDTKFDSDEITELYLSALDEVKKRQLQALTAMHIVGGMSDLPDSIHTSDRLDMYIYQSGHNREKQSNTYRQAEHFASQDIARPVINSEPCYEGHGHGNAYGRFTAFDVRRAFWSSVLSGASAGFTYGAHGIWSWHRLGASFTSEGWSLMPFEWRTAMQLQGSWDVAYGASVFRDMEFQRLKPSQDLLVKGDDGIRVAATDERDLVVMYVPFSVNLSVHPMLANHRIRCVDLGDRNHIAVEHAVHGNAVAVSMVQKNTDYLLIFERD